MGNYLCINGNKIKLTKEQIAKITKSVVPANVKLSDKAVGETFKIGHYEFVVLEHSNDTTAVIMKDILKNSKFSDADCDFKKSIVKKELDAFADEISDFIGAENLISHTVDLTSNDGLKDYDKTTAKMSILTADLYRRYVETLDSFKPEKWYWLATPYSTPKHGYDKYILCVTPSGYVSDSDNYGNGNGVRPFCILNSNIFVS